jgi:UTP--glucose-1-phosphate uridylyltransferase
MAKKVTKAVIAAAGLGTRFLPMTKAMPKEMLPIIDKPIIQYVVEEAVAAGITDIIIVGSANKRPIEDHFDHQYELEAKLERDGKDDMLKELRRIAEMANFVYLRQKPMYSGNATPVINAAHLLNDEPFLYLYADDFFRSDVPRSVSLVETYEKTGKTVIALTPMDRRRSSKYGCADIKQEISPGTFRLAGLVEKPEPSDAPHKDDKIFVSTSGMVLAPEILPVLQTQQPDPRNGELWVAWAVHALAGQDEVYGQVIDGTWHDCGNKEKYLEAIVDVALADESIAPAFKDFLKDKLAAG